MKAIAKFKGLLAQKRARESASGGGDTSQAAEEDSAASHAARIIKEREQFLNTTRARGASEEEVHGQEPTKAKTIYLGIGNGGHDGFTSAEHAPEGGVSASPTAVDFSVYDRAFEAEVDRIKRSTSKRGTRRGTGSMYLTKHVDDKQKYETDDNVTWVGGSLDDTPGTATPRGGSKFADLVARTIESKNRENPSSET